MTLGFAMKNGEDPKVYQALLENLYKKTSNDFVRELEQKKISHLIPPRNDGLEDTSRWFLSGIGNNSIEANMAARAARKNSTSPGAVSHFKTHSLNLYNDITDIEKIRISLSANKDLISLKVLEKTESGAIIPSKSMIGLLRKIKPGDFATLDEYIAKIQSKSSDLLGVSLDKKTIIDLTTYFRKVDSLSPPLFSTERVLIDLNKANNGIVSIDFAGVGVDNIYQQMKALSEINLSKLTQEEALKKSFGGMQSSVDKVTAEMNQAKENFSKSVSNIEGHSKNQPKFSGDDGIHMPMNKAWSADEKLNLVTNLSQTSDPSKYRVTFVSSHFKDGKVIPLEERSKCIVRAETIEKDLRSLMTGTSKIPESLSKKIITAIDYSPAKSGGSFNLLVGGSEQLSAKEIELIKKSFESTLLKDKGESLGEIIFQKNSLPRK
jgi:hypothetical protein